MKYLLVALCIVNALLATAQKTPLKDHRPWPYIGNAKLQYSWGETGGTYSDKIFQADVQQAGWYQLRIWANLVGGEKIELWVGGTYTGITFTGSGAGWEPFTTNLKLRGGVQYITFRHGSFMVPLAENLQLEFLGDMKAGPPLAPSTPAATTGNRVLPNPAGNYEHDIETAFGYTSFAWVYLRKNTRYVFTTNTTINADPVMHLFHPGNMATMSWMNDNGATGTRESRIIMTAPVDGYYALLLRATKGIAPGTNAYTQLYCNNIMLLEKANIGGTLFKNNIGGTTDSLNFFTCRFNHQKADTRLLLINGQNGNANFYNDDYGSNGGDWQWGFSSRINRAWPAGNKPFLTYVCAYSPFDEGVADTYMGNRNSVAWTFFSNWKQDDCIQAGVGYPLQPNPYNYNCIAWSGGLTDAFYWPAQNFSTWTVYGNDLASFDNYYGNTPARYPGAYTYTRTGATWSNAVVDIWATTNGGTGLYYTHGSVQKPGNNHPHGYDWESKPGSVERSFHPRLGPAGETAANYGTPVNHYIHTGAFARMAGVTGVYGSAEEAVQAGIAVYDRPVLSDAALTRLQKWANRVSTENRTAFDRLYNNWKATWAANAVQSNPAAYCRNVEYKHLNNWCREQEADALPLLCSRYVAGDFLCEIPLCAVSLPRYLPLLDEVKAEYKNNLYNNEGKYRIRSDYANGIYFIEKLLQQPPVKPEAASIAATISVQPNPVSSNGIIKITIQQPSKLSISITAAQSRITRIILPETTVPAGAHQYPFSTKELAAAPGQMLTVTAIINGRPQVIKLLVGQ